MFKSNKFLILSISIAFLLGAKPIFASGGLKPVTTCKVPMDKDGFRDQIRELDRILSPYDPADISKDCMPPMAGPPSGEEEREEVKPEIKSVKVKLPSGEPSNLKYGSYRGKAEPAKTVVFLGGGPSASWIDKGRPPMVPEDYDVIVIDYPGIGENKEVKSSEGGKVIEGITYSTEAKGKIVAEMIKELKLSNYILAGHSYGTAVATVAGSALSQDIKANKPEGVVLAGTLGRAFKNVKPGQVHEVNAGYKAVSDRAWSMLSEAEKTKLKNTYEGARAILTDKNTKFLNGIYTQAIPGGPKELAGYLRFLSTFNTEQIIKCFKGTYPRASEMGNNDDKLNLYEEVRKSDYSVSGCEMAETGKASANKSFFDGWLDGGPSGVGLACSCTPWEKNGSWDSSKYQIKDVPIYYVNGTFDANTPLWQTEYHHDQQNSKNKVLVKVEDGGHGVLIGDGNKPCLGSLFGTIFNGGEVRNRLRSFQTNGTSCLNSTAEAIPTSQQEGANN